MKQQSNERTAGSHGFASRQQLNSWMSLFLEHRRFTHHDREGRECVATEVVWTACSSSFLLGQRLYFLSEIGSWVITASEDGEDYQN